MANKSQSGRPGVIKYVRHAKQPSPTSGGCNAWVHGPGVFEFLVEAKGLLCTAYSMIHNLKVTHVDWVEAYVEEGTKRVLIVPAPEETNETAEVAKKGSGVRFNVSTLLKEAKLDVESGYRELYPVVIEEQTIVGTAVVVDMAKESKRKMEPWKARKSSTTQPSDSTPTT